MPDFIFCGMGCASLSLVMRMIKTGQFNDKKIWLIDKEAKTKNDRTWCFWEKEKGFFEDIVYKKWPSITFRSNDFSSDMDISPYEYKMIRGIDFYNYCLEEISKHKNFEIMYSSLNGDEYMNEKNAIVFDSVYRPGNNNKTIRLLQHFKGWQIETKEPFFDPGIATMMDFRVHQERGTTFAYVLPFDQKTALVEYTLFTKKLLKDEEYDQELRKYISEFLKISEYTVKEKEFGVIPMTNEKFSGKKGSKWMIGTAGGQTKASSGYTFQFIQKQSEQIIKKLLGGESLEAIPKKASRFRFYDKVLLDILDRNTLTGEKIFTRLFKKNKPQQVLRFLDNESSLKEELKIISTLPTWPFLKSGIKQLLS